ncbi:MAG: hypothetical protein D6726_04320 [Nitrospirae bacterium]|nr:MAG: hypothetical protein D6726_04320 [Nitrospirota bacterium]
MAGGTCFQTLDRSGATGGFDEGKTDRNDTEYLTSSKGFYYLQLMKNIEDLFQAVRGFMGSRVILTGANLGIFNHLEKPISAGKLAGRLSTDRRATEILLDALTGLGVIKKKGNLYCNTRLSSRFLVEGKRDYQGYILRH